MYDQAWNYIAAIAGDPNTAIIDWRALHDSDKGVAGHARRGTLPQWWQWLCEMNSAGYGIFCTVAMMDGAGRELANVDYIRAHYVDLDNLSSQQNYERTIAAQPAPSFGVNSSGSKWHTYWSVQPYRGNDRFTLIQRKLRQVFDGDLVVDPTRVMRVPGFWHFKNPATPHLVTLQPLANWGQWIDPAQLEAALASVNVIDTGGGRHALGDPDLAAPSLDWLKYGLSLCDPNELSRAEWLSLSAAFKQAGWTLAQPEELRTLWDEWCAKYGANDNAENDKLWNSVRNTELGWHSFKRRIPSLMGATLFNGVQRVAPITSSDTVSAMPDIAAPPPLDCSGEFLTHIEQQEWFKGCMFVGKTGKIYTVRDNRHHNATSFNGVYGGKQFIIDSVGKKTNEAWAAATRSTLWTIPKVDHIRFLPHIAPGDIIEDALGRKGVNVYVPPRVTRTQGDPSPFLRHIAAMLPDSSDQRIFFDWMAHNAKYPGHKIPWAPVIQSVEGLGKGVIKSVMTHVCGLPYVHFPDAQQLADSGGKFNAWMRNKVFILADEIKVDEKRHLIEVLKPLISEQIIEIQGKGENQDLEDNFANWGFFTNYKDAVPVNKNGRRYAIFFSPIQTVFDLMAQGMDDAYFARLYDWINCDGAAIVANWLLNYPIERGAIPMRAPRTSSTAAAVELSRGPVERMIAEAVEDGLRGFRGGWISAIAVANRIKSTGVARNVSAQTVGTIIESMGYAPCGRAPRVYFEEDKDARAYLYHWGQAADVAGYGRLQGYEG